MRLFFVKAASAADISGDDDLRQAISGFSIEGIYGVFDAFSQWILVIGVVAAVIAFGMAGFLFVTSRGDAAKLETAKKTTLWTAAGIVVIVLSRAIIYILGDFFS